VTSFPARRRSRPWPRPRAWRIRHGCDGRSRPSTTRASSTRPAGSTTCAGMAMTGMPPRMVLRGEGPGTFRGRRVRPPGQLVLLATRGSLLLVGPACLAPYASSGSAGVRRDGDVDQLLGLDGASGGRPRRDVATGRLPPGGCRRGRVGRDPAGARSSTVQALARPGIHAKRAGRRRPLGRPHVPRVDRVRLDAPLGPGVLRPRRQREVRQPLGSPARSPVGARPIAPSAVPQRLPSSQRAAEGRDRSTRGGRLGLRRDGARSPPTRRTSRAGRSSSAMPT